MINADDLVKFAKKNLKGQKLVVAIQREPYSHVKTRDGKVKVEIAAGGAHTLLDGILKQTGGLMVSIGSGNADAKVVDSKGRVEIPYGTVPYTLKRIFLKKKELDGFYYGFANQTLWPLSHVVFVKPVFSAAWWDEYLKVNQKFADAISEEMGQEKAFVWINDYHLALLPKMLKEKNPNLTIGTFWHIPWPTYEIFRICPWRKPLLEGLLGSDFIGFHRGYQVDNFTECCRRELQVIIDSEPRKIMYQTNRTKIASLPAGIDYTEIIKELDKTKNNVTSDLIKNDFGFDYEYLAIGVDRIDYTKGLVERLKMIDVFLEKYPEYQGKFVYLSIAVPSRIHIPAYKALNREVTDLVERINWKYSTIDWQPIYFIDQVIPREKLFSYYRLADACIVTSLDDGMNLVAKEYAICCKPDKGTLLLSKFAGAAKDLSGAFQINPYDIPKTADVLNVALKTKSDEKLKRNHEMKEVLKEYNIYKWGIKFMKNTLSKDHEVEEV